MTKVEHLLATAFSETGYIGKRTNEQLEEKDANLFGPYNKYAQEIIELGDWTRVKKNGGAWCCLFVMWCFYKAFGEEEAILALNEKKPCSAAAVYYLARYLEKAGAYHDKEDYEPVPGDIVIFGNYAHTGIVTSVSPLQIKTVEGNRTLGGGRYGVGIGTYSTESSYIKGYCTPLWDKVTWSDDKPEPDPKAEYDVYTVVRGDCLWNIAKKFYNGKGHWYKAIVKYNGIEGKTLRPGMVLKIPKDPIPYL